MTAINLFLYDCKLIEILALALFRFNVYDDACYGCFCSGLSMLYCEKTIIAMFVAIIRLTEILLQVLLDEDIGKYKNFCE